ncbi:DUF58 domain-containing protein [Rubinisphaera margarita]|uniref:DUF58 domain-containing protein n=1 Tax=Rubinisphaera margarita TaxID=2909586 RepID=UPI001EE93C79|nr:DUF58 domain-containing protein [Rubinisphaera margarita]MCG6155159.1 DUF58 domain-containing protein [Rubinisphaera margarita]
MAEPVPPPPQTDVLNDPVVQQAISRYQLGLPRLPTAGRTGELLGRGTGSSLEFQEYREYVPGDDLRHVDWGAYARSDALMVRLFREEISPRTEIIVDGSISMTTQNGVKQQLALQLTSLLAQLTGRLGGAPAIHLLNSVYPPLRLDLNSLGKARRFSFDGTESLSELLNQSALTLKPQSIRIVISDFLFPHDPDQLVKRLATRASALWLIQVLADWEWNPQSTGGRRLIDIESLHHADMIVSQSAIQTYKERLNRLREGLMIATRRAHASFVALTAEDGLEQVCRNELSASGLLRPV